MAEDKARVAVIGTGWWATTAHLPALRAHPDAELVAISDVRPDVLRKAAQEYDVATTYTDYGEMLAKESLDGAVVSVWHAAHYGVARACLEAGLHVMLEKPMTLTAAHARDLVELARSRGRELIIGYPYHFAAHVLRAREVLQSGELGEVRYVNCLFASVVIQLYRGDDKTYEPFFNYPVVGPGDVYSDPERSGGGQGHLQVTHAAALMHFITGLRPASVIALMNNLDVKVDVVDAMVVRLDNGALATVGSTGILNHDDPERLYIQVYCDHGSLDVDFTTGAGRIRHADGSKEVLEPAGSEAEAYPMRATSINLVEVILGRAANGSPAEFGLHTVDVLDAAYRSAADNGRAVSVEELYGAPAGPAGE